MDMGSLTMSMAMASSTASSAATATSAAMDMSGMGMGGDCQISMLWNWYTVDACFISSSWHVTSKAMFAGSCIGVILLVMSLEFLRRLSKEYDAYILRQFQLSLADAPYTRPSSSEVDKGAPAVTVNTTAPLTFRPSVVQHAIRSALHMLQFAVAYFVMLLAMYFNGYIIISIVIGAYLGFFVFGWDTIKIGAPGNGQQQEATMCCG